MKIKLLAITLFVITLTGCDKQAEPPTSKQSENPTITAQFEQSDEKISKFLDQLDDPNTSQEVRKQILCRDYPKEYKENYMPALMELSPGEYTEGKLIKDLDIALDYYKKKDNVQC